MHQARQRRRRVMRSVKLRPVRQHVSKQNRRCKMATIQLFNRSVGPVSVNVVVREKHSFEIGITSNPIETGAEVNDHAYVMPKKLTLEIADGNATETLAALVALQESRVPFVCVSGWHVYRNMLVKAINADRDAAFSKVLRATVDLQEVIIVDTAYAAGEGGATNGERGKTAGQSKKLSPSRAKDDATAKRSVGTVQRGDSPGSTVPPERGQSLLRSLTR